MAGFFGKLFGGWRGESRDDRALRMLAESLNEISGGWTVARGAVHGPGTRAIAIDRQHDGTDAHLCIGFFLDRERADGPIIQDCVASIGRDFETRLRSAVKIWMTSTAPVLLELIEQSGRFADHFRGDDPSGFAGWHGIHGPIFGYGTGSAKDDVQAWALEHPLLPQLRESIATYLDRTSPNGIKLFFGGSPESRVAEVRLGGVELPEALRGPRAPGLASAIRACLHARVRRAGPRRGGRRRRRDEWQRGGNRQHRVTVVGQESQGAEIICRKTPAKADGQYIARSGIRPSGVSQTTV